MNEIVYFELNNWFAGRDYPDNERFINWMHDDLNIKFRSEKWAEENRLCIAARFIDMSQNFCVTATKEWVEKNCPELLTDYTQFLRYPDDEYGDVYGRFGDEFLPYEEENFGVTWIDLDDEYEEEEEEEET